MNNPVFWFNAFVITGIVVALLAAVWLYRANQRLKSLLAKDRYREKQSLARIDANNQTQPSSPSRAKKTIGMFNA